MYIKVGQMEKKLIGYMVTIGIIFVISLGVILEGAGDLTIYVIGVGILMIIMTWITVFLSIILSKRYLKIDQNKITYIKHNKEVQTFTMDENVELSYYKLKWYVVLLIHILDMGMLSIKLKHKRLPYLFNLYYHDIQNIREKTGMNITII